MNINQLLLLPAFVKRAKDAAHAVKQGIYTTIHQMTESILTILRDFPHFQVTGYGLEKEAEQDILHLYYTFSHSPF